MKIKKVVVDDLGDKKIVPKGKVKFYKPAKTNMTREEMRALTLSITDGASCDCDTLEDTKSRKLIMGTMQGSRFVVTYVSEWSKNKEFKRAVKAIRKGHDCKQQIEKEIGGQNENNGGLSISEKPPTHTGVDVSIGGGGGFEVPDMGGEKPSTEKNKDKNKSRREKNKKEKGKGKKGKGKKGRRKNKKDKQDKKDKEKKEDTDPMANIGKSTLSPHYFSVVFTLLNS